jgi:hypothetical protein
MEASEPAPAGTIVYDSPLGGNANIFYGEGYYAGGETSEIPDQFEQQINNLGVVSDLSDC